MGLENTGAKAALNRVSTPFSADELEAIDAWGFARRMRNRSDVIRELVRRGISATETDAPTAR